MKKEPFNRFEYILLIDDAYMPKLLRELDTCTIVPAIVHESKEIQEKILRNLPEKGAKTLLEDLKEYELPKYETDEKKYIRERKWHIFAAFFRLCDAGEAKLPDGYCIPE